VGNKAENVRARRRSTSGTANRRAVRWNDSGIIVSVACLSKVESLSRRFSSTCRATAKGCQTPEVLILCQQLRNSSPRAAGNIGARIRMAPGSGKIDIMAAASKIIFQPYHYRTLCSSRFQTAKALMPYDLWINASGGGAVGQAGAAQLAIARRCFKSMSICEAR